MPVVTRSQSKLQKPMPNVLPSIEKQAIDYQQQQVSKKCFVTLISKKLKETDKEEKMINKLRILSEIFYIIRDWFDVVICVDGVIMSDMNKFLKIVYEKSNEFLVDVYKINIETAEDHLIQKIFIDEVNAMLKIVRPYI